MTVFRFVDQEKAAFPVTTLCRTLGVSPSGSAVFDYIEAFYNPRRRHSSLGQLSPAEFERRYRPESPAA